jgi:mRNA-degrading endonuclease YafQ of YafQ-DinJ toxin-antitoxin module
LLNGKESRLENIQRVIDDLVEQRLALTQLLKDAQLNNDKALIYDLNKQAVSIGDELSKYNKAKNDIHKAGRLTLEQYLEMMQMLFDDMRKHDEKLYNATLDFQENHVQFISKQLG